MSRPVNAWRCAGTIAAWRFRRFFATFSERLHARITLLALCALCLTNPTSLATFYESLLARSFAWLPCVGLGTIFLALQGAARNEWKILNRYERSLPLPNAVRWAIDYWDSLLLQTPVLALLFIAAMMNRLEFHRRHPLRDHLGITLGFLLVAGIVHLLALSWPRFKPIRSHREVAAVGDSFGLKILEKWPARRDSNSRHPVPKTGALSN